MLKERDARFSFLADRGKGSHMAITHPEIAGQRRFLPIPTTGSCRKEIPAPYLKQIIRTFNLPADFFD